MASLKLIGLQSPLPSTSTVGAPTPVTPSGFTAIAGSAWTSPLAIIAETAISVAEVLPGRSTNILLLYPTANTFVGGSIGYPL